MPTLVPADLPSTPSRPSGSRGHIHSGPVSWAGCPATAGTPTPLGAALVAGWLAMSGQGRGGGEPGTPAGPPALNRTGEPARDPTCRPAGSSVVRRAVGWTPGWGRAWGLPVMSTGTGRSEMRHVSIQMLDWKSSPSTWSRAPQDGPTPAPNRGARSQKSSFRKMCLKSSSNENPRSEGQGGHWCSDRGWQ